MGFIDDVVVNAKSAAEMVGKTAGKIVDVSKLKVNLTEVNADIRKKYEALGEYVAENAQALFFTNAEVTGKVAEIDHLKEQAEAIKKELMDKQNKISCPKCGKLSPIGVAFCSECGTKLSDDKVEPADCHCEGECEEEKAEEKKDDSAE